MNIFYKAYCRIYQKILKTLSLVVNWPSQEVVSGVNILQRLPELILDKNLNRPIVITDKTIGAMKFTIELLESLSSVNLEYVIYDETIPNPTIDNVEMALNLYKKNKCDSIIAIGGGSSIDCAKAVGARVVKPKKTIESMKGLLKVRKKLPLLIAIPTTSGTGSEATIASVITDGRTHHKYAINDLVLIPKYAILDPMVTVDLPKNITSTTGMDALTHAIEAYIGRSNTEETKELSKKAIKLIYENLYKAYEKPNDLIARENMQMASYYAGVAFTKAYVGYVHAIAHSLGGFYSVPHGLANAVVLPYVLEAYGESIYSSLGELADYLKLSTKEDTAQAKSFKFINSIKELNERMEIPNKICLIEKSDIKMLAKRAVREAHPLYPVPKLLSLEEIIDIYNNVKE